MVSAVPQHSPLACPLPSSPSRPSYRHQDAPAGVDDAHALVLAGGAEEAAVAVPADIVDEVGVQAVQAVQLLRRAHVPDEHHIVTACQAGGHQPTVPFDHPPGTRPGLLPPVGLSFPFRQMGLGEGVCGGAGAGEQCRPALSSTLRAVGCQVMMPTRLVCPSSTTTGSVSGEASPFSGICHTCGRGEAAS